MLSRMARFGWVLLFLVLMGGKVRPARRPALAFPMESTPVQAVSDLTPVQPQVTYRFGENVHIESRLQTDRPIRSVQVLLRPEKAVSNLVIAMQPAGDRWVADFVPREEHYMPPFVTVFYWFQVKYQDGTGEESASFTFQYEDNRFRWEQLTRPPFQVHWPQGMDAEIAYQVLQFAQSSLERMRIQWLAPKPQRVRLFLYPTEEDLEAVLFGPPEWAGSYALPRWGLVFLVAGEDRPVALDVATAHEVAHVVMFQALGGDADRLPWWLNEGLASLAEPVFRERYQQVLSRAWEDGTLYPMSALCAAPLEREMILAYAQAASFTNFLYLRFGARPLHTLLLTYAGGVGCEQGIRQVYGQSLAELDARWRQEELAYSATALRSQIPPVALWLAALGAASASLGAVFFWIRRFESDSAGTLDEARKAP